uniref:G-protein coupled receptors family 1 profile domain-containing protein n=1 Tax=Plectus sambesii TaxID=2011161 RepID=A0A914XHQ1_9BILA
MNGTDLPDCEICVADPEASTYRIYNSIVIGILVPVVGVLGIVGNALSAAVYSLPAMKSSVNMYLFALAISDIVVVITGIFLYFLLSIECAGPFVTMIYGLGASYVFPVSHIAQTSSVYLVVCAAIDCFVSTVGPVSIRKHMCTVQNARRAVIAIAIFSVVYNLPHWFEIEVVDCYEAQWNMTLVMLTQTALRLNELYITVYYIYMYTAVLTVGPLALLIILNSTIIIKTVCTKKDSDSREGEVQYILCSSLTDSLYSLN